MGARELYKQLINEIDVLAKKKGFLRKRQYLYLKRDNNWGLIGFQKSRKSTANEITFIINLGVFSGNIQNFLSEEMSSEYPLIEDCHWRERLGSLLPNPEDKWWTIQEPVSFDSLVSELSVLINQKSSLPAP